MALLACLALLLAWDSSSVFSSAAGISMKEKWHEAESVQNRDAYNTLKAQENPGCAGKSYSQSLNH